MVIHAFSPVTADSYARAFRRSVIVVRLSISVHYRIKIKLGISSVYKNFEDLERCLLQIGSQWNQHPKVYGKWNSVYRFHLPWSKRGLFCEILETLAVKKSKDPIRAIEATHIKVHQDACRHALRPEERGLGKTKGEEIAEFTLA